MNTLLQQQLDELLARSARQATLECERALRVGAATLRLAPHGEITATTVVCNIVDDDVDAVESLASDIADEYGLAASIQHQPGSYSVRFTGSEAREAVKSVAAEKSLLARLLGR